MTLNIERATGGIQAKVQLRNNKSGSHADNDDPKCSIRSVMLSTTHAAVVGELLRSVVGPSSRHGCDRIPQSLFCLTALLAYIIEPLKYPPIHKSRDDGERNMSDLCYTLSKTPGDIVGSVLWPSVAPFPRYRCDGIPQSLSSLHFW